MKTELQKELLQKYEKFFSHTSKPIYTGEDLVKDTIALINQKEVVEPIQFGIEVEDGWYNLINELFYQIKQHIEFVEASKNGKIKYKFLDNLVWELMYRGSYGNKISKKLGAFIKSISPKIKNYKLEFDITQIKEKYGSLRIYYNGGDDYIDGMVNLIESLSYMTCEKCGTTTNVGHTKGYILIICEDCHRKTNKGLYWEKIK